MELNNYLNISNEVLKGEIDSRTNKILLLKEKNANYKNILTALISNLNSLLLVSNNNFKLSKVREKDLEMNQSTKANYKSLISSMNSNDKNDEIEEKIRKLRNENKEITIQIRKYTDKNTVKVNEIEDWKKNQNLISIKKEELKLLKLKQEEYVDKLNNNKTLFDNIINEFNQFQLNYSKKKKAPLIDKWITALKNDLSYDTETIIQNVNNSEVNVIDLIEEERAKTNQTLDTSNRMKLPSICLRLTESTKEIKKRIYLGVFSKFSYLKENSKNKEALIAYDYDNTTEDDFNDLVSKCGRLKETNSHLEKSIDEYKKFSNKKFSSITKTIRNNSNELNRLKEKNAQLKQEILNLTKILELTIEKKSMCNNQNKIFIPKLQSSIFTEPSDTIIINNQSEDYSFKE